MPKIIDIISKHQKEHPNKPFFSFEYFPPKTEQGVENLYERLARMSLLGPSWIDVTWGAGGSTSQLTLEICETAQNFLSLETMMHLTCTNLPVKQFEEALKRAKNSGIRNILALRGDPPRGEAWKPIEGGFAHAADLVRYIRKHYGDYFGICVAGYPEGHVDATSYEDDLKHLKEKVDAGADVIITQLFYDANLFIKFEKDCRAIGIKVPIIPELMPINGYAGFSRMLTLCKTYVPKEIVAALEPIKHDDEAVKNYGVTFAIQMCRTLLEHGAPGLHFCTLNLEKSTLQILTGLGLVEGEIRPPLPWQMPARKKEDVRPIFWSHRPKSYVTRTATWDEFPNGRWGDSRSPAFGDLTDHHLMSLHASKSFDRLQAWGSELKSEQDIWDVFAKFCAGQLERLPWWDSALSPETDLIKDVLIKINKAGFLTTNSQPAVNGAKSTDEKFGWGPSGGFCYQKAYIEFFASPTKVELLRTALKKFPDLTYYAVNLKDDAYSSHTSPSPTAVTWGIFPGKEIVQPTIVEPYSFLVWKDEAFGLWKSQWASLYAEGTKSRQVIDGVIDSYFLVNIVDNNYVSGNIFAVFDAVMALEHETKH